jgi:hypothetical protein
MRHAIGHRHVLAALAVAAGLAGFAEVWRRQVAGVVAHLEQRSGEVLAARAVNGRPTRRLATVRFEVAGRAAAVHGVVEPVEVGQQARVWFDPRDPERTATLQPPAGLRRGPVLLLAVAALIAAVAARMAREVSWPAAAVPARARPAREARAAAEPPRA